MNWKKWTVIIVIVLFVAVNFYLMFKKESEITRTKYINEWRSIKEQNLVLSKEKSGVVAPLVEEHVYFQSGEGDFQQFLVKEGEEVSEGTPLFEYSPKNLEQAIQQYEAEIDRLESEKEALEDNIDNLEKIEKKLSSKKDEEESTSNDAVASTIEAQIYEKELQLSKLEADIEKFEDYISLSQGSKGSLVVESPISGVVKKISQDLQNPVITITSFEQHIEGILEEKELSEIQPGMKVITYGSYGKLEGTVSYIAANPSKEPQVDTESQYPFTVEFSESSEEIAEDKELEEEEDMTEETEEVLEPEPVIYTGTHVDVKVIVREVENALTLPKKAIRNGKIYVLKGNGTIEERKVETGVYVNDVFEITSEVAEGELVIYEPAKIKHNTRFFTPVELRRLEKKSLKEIGKKEALKYFAKGLLSR